MRHILLIPWLVSFVWFGNPEGSKSLWKKLAELEQTEQWVIIVGGNEIVQISIKNRQPAVIVAERDGYPYDWHAAVMSPDGKFLAARRSTEPAAYNDLVLINWDLFRKKRIVDDSVLSLPVRDYEVSRFAWSPDSKRIVFLGKRRIPGKRDWENEETPEKAYLLDLARETVDEIETGGDVSYIGPTAWYKQDQVVYGSRDDSVWIYGLKTMESKVLGEGRHPNWNSAGTLIVYQDPESWDYYQMGPDGEDKKLFLKQNVPKQENGSIYGPIIWSPDDRFIMYGRQTGWAGGFDDIYIQELATGFEAKVAESVGALYLRQGSWVSLRHSAVHSAPDLTVPPGTASENAVAE